MTTGEQAIELVNRIAASGDYKEHLRMINIAKEALEAAKKQGRESALEDVRQHFIVRLFGEDA